MGRQTNWATFSARRKMMKNGSEAANADVNPADVERALFEKDGDRNRRLRHWLKTGPRGERDVDAILDATAVQAGKRPDGSGIWVPRAERDSWLRGILDACPAD